MKEIEFGTDGWRGVIARDFTFENVKVVAQAVADYLKSVRRSSFVVRRSKNIGRCTMHDARCTTVVIGYDTRFLSDRFAMAVASILASNKIRVILSKGVIPSPALSYSVVNEKANLGIMITASHNPPHFNGFKIKTELGTPADEKITEEIERYLYRNKPADYAKASSPRIDGNDKIEIKDLIPAYLKKISSLVDMEILRNVRFQVICDPMFGAGTGLLPAILKKTKCRVFSIHSDPDPLFGGVNPEPIKRNLGDLMKEVVKKKADIGIATDGDADRIGLVDDTGRYLTPHQVFPLLLSFLIEVKGLRGKIVQTISLGYLGERIAHQHGLLFQEVPVGFKYVSNLMLTHNVLAGGEESGGFGFRGHIPEREGILNSLVFLEMIAKKKKRLSCILDELEKEFGKSCYDRIDLKIDSGLQTPDIRLKTKMTEAIIKKVPKRIAGMKVREIRTYDGVKFVLGSSNIIGGEAWLLLRPSGTEPLVRIYAEANSQAKVRELLKAGKQMVFGIAKII